MPAKKKAVKKKIEANTLVPLETYLSAGIHIGTNRKTKYMSKYIYNIRPDGLSILNISQIDERLRILAEFISKLEPDDLLVVARRENAKKAVKMFNKATGIKVMVGRYLPGTLTNPNFENYVEPKVILINDVWYDKQALKDALSARIMIIALCDTNNNTNNVDFVVPCNNKGRKSLGLIYYILAREYCKAKKLDFPYKLEQFS